MLDGGHGDCKTMKVYLAANFDGRNKIACYAEIIENAIGVEVVGDWFKGAGAGAYNGESPTMHALDCFSSIAECDVFVQFEDFPGQPTRGGKHTEWGYAFAKGKYLVLVGEPYSLFHHLPGVQVVSSFLQLARLLEQMRDAFDKKHEKDILEVAKQCKRDEAIRAVAESEPVIDWFRREGGVL